MFKAVLRVVVGCSLASAIAFAGDLKITTSVKDGDVIAGEKKIDVTIDTKEFVNAVELYVGGKLRTTDDSTPYEFVIDTIKEAEGDVSIKFIASAANGDRGEKTLKLKIDNQLSKGADFFVDKANDALSVGKWDEAMILGRTALKAKAGSTGGLLILARGSLGKGQLDVAENYVQQVLETDKNNTQALDLYSAISLKKAFRIANTSSDLQNNLKTIRKAVLEAAESRSKVYEQQLNALGAVTEENRLSIADQAARCNRYGLVIETLMPAYRKAPDNTLIVNQLIYSMLRAGRIADAVEIATNYEKRGHPDGEGYALLSVLAGLVGDETKSSDFERQAVLNDSTSMGVKTGRAFLSMYRYKKSDLLKLVNSMLEEADGSPVVNYYAVDALYAASDFEASRKRFESTILAEPAMYDIYILQATILMRQTMSETNDKTMKEYYREFASIYFDAALAAKPESFEAFTGKALLALQKENTADAVKYSTLATKAGAQYAAGHYVASLAYSLLDRDTTSKIGSIRTSLADAQANNNADDVTKYTKMLADANEQSKLITVAITDYKKSFTKFDKRNLEGHSIPSFAEAYSYFAKYGRTPLMIIHKANP